MILLSACTAVVLFCPAPRMEGRIQDRGDPIRRELDARTGVLATQEPEPPPEGGLKIAIGWDPRGDEPYETHEIRSGGERSECRIDGVAFVVWVEDFAGQGLEARRVTVGAINGYAGRGPAYFERYRVEVEGQPLADLRGQHVLLPRGALLRRGWYGPDARAVRSWTYVEDARRAPSWAAKQALEDTASERVTVGPYRFFWSNEDLGDSHGGQGIGPFHGGPDDWLTCPEGRQNRELEFLLEFQRPIWFLGPQRPQPYWMGRTEQHELEGYRDWEVDEWCPYAARLRRFKFHDHTHLSRGTAGAAALAQWDVVARECLLMVFEDFKMAHDLERPVEREDNHLLWPLWRKIEVAGGPASSSEGDRGLAHRLRLLRWCRPYAETEPWASAMREWTRKLSDQYGVTSAGTNPPWAASEITPPYCYTFGQQLVCYEMARFGGLDDLARRLRRFLTPRPPVAFEVRDGAPDDTVNERAGTKERAVPSYGHFTHGVLLTHANASTFLQGMRWRDVNGSSQDLDNTPRELWSAKARRGGR